MLPAIAGRRNSALVKVVPPGARLSTWESTHVSVQHHTAGVPIQLFAVRFKVLNNYALKLSVGDRFRFALEVVRNCTPFQIGFVAIVDGD